MHDIMHLVLDFHDKMGQPIGDPRAPDITNEQEFRRALIAEEYKELKNALDGFHKDKDGVLVPFESPEQQIAHVADGIGDLVYVLAGSAAVWGIDMGQVFMAIHASNMTKTPNPAGKTTKGPNFKPVDLIKVLEESKAEFSQEDYFGDYWPHPRKNRIGSTQAELAQVQLELDLLDGKP